MRETFICSHCRETYDLEDRHCFDGVELCPGCLDEQTVICEHCGRRVWTDSAADSSRILCEHCYCDYYTDCEGCGRTIHLDDACYMDEDDEYPYCRDCYERRSSSEYIHDYNFKPEPIFYGDGNRYFGVELEIDGGGSYDSNAEKIADTANLYDKHIYIKHDGSLNEGKTIGMIDGYNVIPSYAVEMMKTVHRLYGVSEGNMLIHVVVSLHPKYGVAPEAMMNYAGYIVQGLKNYQVVYGVHIDTDHTHIHLMINPVSIRNGIILTRNKAEWAIRMICKKIFS